MESKLDYQPLFTEVLWEKYKDPSWLDSNTPILRLLTGSQGLALAGSILGAYCGSSTDLEQPGDIDIVAADYGTARMLISDLESRLMDMKYAHWRLYVNHKTKFVPSNCCMHIRLQSSIWLPVCVFVLKEGQFSSWFTKEAMPMQNFKDAQEAMDEMSERDQKPRRTLVDDRFDMDLGIEFSDNGNHYFK